MKPSPSLGSLRNGDDPALFDLAEEMAARLQSEGAADVEVWIAAQGEHAGRLRRLLPTVQVMAELGSAAGGAGPPPGPEDEPVSGVLGDFRILRQLGRGGMGIVYEAEQVSLGRRVALKVLPFAATMDPRQLQRFHNEARAAAGLHHTNIVPVYGVGCERGVHYYAMQFIEGRTLADVIAEQRDGLLSQVPTMAEAAAASATTVPPVAQATSAAPRDAAYFRRLAEWGIQAAEALDCAHSLGVVHRDIKPANLLVDATDRLWVTDFGLAQVHSDARLTMTGDLVGTLRYMSPEQALAQRVVIDHRTDVYSLGATLYELLTLRPVFAGHDRQELLRQIAFEEPKPPRRINKAIPAELETIVLKAMEKNPADRYATAKELAEDLGRYLRDESIHARRPSLFRRARKWARRHQPLVTAAVVCLVVTLVALVGSITWVWGERAAHRREAEAKVREALDAAEPALQRGNPWDPALTSAAQRAEAQLGTGVIGPASRANVEQLLRDRDMLVRLEAARLQAAAGGKKGFDYAGADRLYAEAFEWYGLDMTTLGAPEAAGRVRVAAISAHLTAGLDDWAMLRDKLIEGGGAALRAVADLADDDPWRRQLRGAAARRDREALEGLAEEKGALSQPPANLVLLAGALRMARSRAAAERLLRQAQAGHPADFWINFNLEATLDGKTPPDPAERVRFLQAALALRPRSPVVYINLGAAFRDQGKLAEAEAAFRKATELQPDFALAHYNLGVALDDQGKSAEAEAAFHKAIELKPDDVDAHINLGNALQNQGKPVEAEAAFHKAIELKPDDPEAHTNLGVALRNQGKLPEAEQAHRKAIELKLDYADAHSNLGNALADQGKLPEAVAAYRKAIELKPKDAEFHYNLASALQEQHKLADAVEVIRKAIGIRPGWALAYNKLGNILSDQGKPVEAATAYQKAIACQGDFAMAYNNLGIALIQQQKTEEAVAAFKKAVELEPHSAVFRDNLDKALEQSDRRPKGGSKGGR